MSNLIVAKSTIKRTNPATGLVEEISAVLIPTKNADVFAIKLQEEQFGITLDAGGFPTKPKSALMKFNRTTHPALANLVEGDKLAGLRIRTQYSVNKPFYTGQKAMKAGALGNMITVGGFPLYMQRTPVSDPTLLDDPKPVYDTVAAPAAAPVAAPAATLTV